MEISKAIFNVKRCVHIVAAAGRIIFSELHTILMLDVMGDVCCEVVEIESITVSGFISVAELIKLICLLR